MLTYRHQKFISNISLQGFTKLASDTYVTENPYIALKYIDHANEIALKQLLPLEEAIQESLAIEDWGSEPIPAPTGMEYYPFQIAGIRYAIQYNKVLIGDQPGLGKTIQAVGVANYFGFKNILVVCPASLRLNWEKEIKNWLITNSKTNAILNGKAEVKPDHVNIISYDLLKKYLPHLLRLDIELLIVDEAHFVKNPTTIRTKIVMKQLVERVNRVVLLTGTPIPNRPNEFHGILKKLVPNAIDNMGFQTFLNYYCQHYVGDYGPVITGTKNEKELWARLRSNFMVRRLKTDVLKSLPPKVFNTIAIPPTPKIKKIIKRESEFNPHEIVEKGAKVGTSLPEIRHNMGVAKAPLVVQYIENLIESGLEKIIIFAHHREVISRLAQGLKTYQPVVVTGATTPTAKQNAVDRFQSVPSVKVFIGNIVAAGTGFTLTAAADVVFAETSYVPGENEQAIDRAHRIGQTATSVNIHYIVIEGSLDAQILEIASSKQRNINQILDNFN